MAPQTSPSPTIPVLKTSDEYSRLAQPTGDIDRDFKLQDRFEEIALAAPSTAYIPEHFSPQDDLRGSYNPPGSPASRSLSSYRQSFTDVLDRVKLPPLITGRASTASTFSAFSSASSSPSKSSRPSTPQHYIESLPIASSSASSASTRRRHSPSKSLVSNFLSTYPDEYPEPDHHEMADLTSYTRSPRAGRARNGSGASVQNSKFGWLSKASDALSGITSRPSTSSRLPSDDPLISLDVQSALFPHGPADPLDPSAFNDLLANAESLIARLQAAYKEKCLAVTDLRSEQEVLNEEFEEADTRSRHLRMQLEEMSTRTSEKEQSLRMQLEKERSRRQDLEARVHGEDHSLCGGSDSEVESEVDSEATSRTAQSSPTFAQGEFDQTETFPTREKISSFTERPRKLSKANPYHQPPIINSMSAAANQSCRTCKGLSTPVAGDLRFENQRLRMRIGELEKAVDSCLDLVSSRI